jgi:hypothetical protein
MSTLAGRGVAGKVVIVMWDVIRDVMRDASLALARARSGNDFGGGVILGIADDDDAASAGFDFIALGDALGRIVGALGVKIGANLANECAHIFFWKDYDCVHVGERCQNFGALLGWHYRTAFTLQGANGIIGVDGDNQFAAEFVRCMQIADMAYVQNVEAAVGEGDAIASAPPVSDDLR